MEQESKQKWGHLAQQNVNRVLSTGTIDFINKEQVPKCRDVTYTTFILDYTQLKLELHQVHITVGGDKL